MVSNTRLYGAAIALVSGGYSLWGMSAMNRMTATGWLMGLLGVVVILHGAVLLTAYADRWGEASGPLMIVYAAIMLLNQALLGTGMMDGSGTMGGTMMGDSAMSAGMGWDAGMVAVALLMLASGVIMSQGEGMDASDGM